MTQRTIKQQVSKAARDMGLVLDSKPRGGFELREQVLNAEARGEDLERHARIGRMCKCWSCFCCHALMRLEELKGKKNP